MTDAPPPLHLDNSKFNVFKERMQDWDESWQWIGRHMIKYDWNYRKKICTKCPLETKKKWKCYTSPNSSKIIDGVKIQKTYCKKLKNARANKFRNHIKHALALNPFLKSG